MSEVAAQSEKARPRRFRPYPEYRDSGVEWLGEIPAHWEVKRLKTLASVQLSNVDKHSEESQVPVTLCNYVDVYYNDLITADLEFMSATATPEQVRRFLLRAGDVLITKDSESWNDIAVPTVVAEDLTDVLCGYHLAQITPGQGLDGRFLARQFSAIGTRDQFHIAAKGITRFGLGGDAIRTGLFPIAPMEEQRAIADFLDRETAKIDALVAKKKRLIELLQGKRTALITRAVTRGLDPNVPMKESGVEWLGEIPAHWEVKRLKNVSTFVTSGSRGWAEFYSDEGPFFLRIGNVQSGSIDLNIDDVQHVDPPRGSEGERTRVKPGDVLVSITALIGAVAVVSDDLPEAFVNQHLALIRLSTSEADPRWIAYCIMSPIGQTQFAADLYGGTKDGLGLDDVRSLVVLKPPIREQERIVTYLDSQGTKLMKLVQTVRTAIDHLKEFRTALISAAVTGKIDVRDAAPR